MVQSQCCVGLLKKGICIPVQGCDVLHSAAQHGNEQLVLSGLKLRSCSHKCIQNCSILLLKNGKLCTIATVRKGKEENSNYNNPISLLTPFFSDSLKEKFKPITLTHFHTVLMIADRLTVKICEHQSFFSESYKRSKTFLAAIKRQICVSWELTVNALTAAWVRVFWDTRFHRQQLQEDEAHLNVKTSN